MITLRRHHVVVRLRLRFDVTCHATFIATPAMQRIPPLRRFSRSPSLFRRDVDAAHTTLPLRLGWSSEDAHSAMRRRCCQARMRCCADKAQHGAARKARDKDFFLLFSISLDYATPTLFASRRRRSPPSPHTPRCCRLMLDAAYATIATFIMVIFSLKLVSPGQSA